MVAQTENIVGGAWDVFIELAGTGTPMDKDENAVSHMLNNALDANPHLTLAERQAIYNDNNQRFSGDEAGAAVIQMIEDIGIAASHKLSILVYEWAMEIAEALTVGDTIWDIYRCEAHAATVAAEIEGIVAFVTGPALAETAVPAAAPFAALVGRAVAIFCAIDELSNVKADKYTTAATLQIFASELITLNRRVLMHGEPDLTEWSSTREGGRVPFCLEGYHRGEWTYEPGDGGGFVYHPNHPENQLVVNYMNNTTNPFARQCRMYNPDFLTKPEKENMCENAELMCDITAARNVAKSVDTCIDLGAKAAAWWLEHGYPPSSPTLNQNRVVRGPERAKKAPMVGMMAGVACLFTPSAQEIADAAGDFLEVPSIKDITSVIMGTATPAAALGPMEQLRSKILAPITLPKSLPQQIAARKTCIANHQIAGCGFDPTISVGDGKEDLRRYATGWTDLQKVHFLKNASEPMGYTDANGVQKTLNCSDDDPDSDNKILCSISPDEFPSISEPEEVTCTIPESEAPDNRERVIESSDDITWGDGIVLAQSQCSGNLRSPNCGMQPDSSSRSTESTCNGYTTSGAPPQGKGYQCIWDSQRESCDSYLEGQQNDTLCTLPFGEGGVETNICGACYDSGNVLQESIDHASCRGRSGHVWVNGNIAAVIDGAEVTYTEPTLADVPEAADDVIPEGANCDCLIKDPDNPDICIGREIYPPDTSGVAEWPGDSRADDLSNYGLDESLFTTRSNIRIPRINCIANSASEASCIFMQGGNPQICSWNGEVTLSPYSGCAENHHVSDFNCVPCDENYIRTAGDNPLMGHTECTHDDFGGNSVCPVDDTTHEGFYEHISMAGSRPDFNQVDPHSDHYWEEPRMLKCECPLIDGKPSYKKTTHINYPTNEDGTIDYSEQTQICDNPMRQCFSWTHWPDDCPAGGYTRQPPEVCKAKTSEYSACKPICSDPGAVNWSPSQELAAAGDFTELDDDSIESGCYQKIDKPSGDTSGTYGFEVNVSGLPDNYLEKFIPEFGYVDENRVTPESPGTIIPNLEPTVLANNIPLSFWPPGTTEYTEENKITIDYVGDDRPHGSHIFFEQIDGFDDKRGGRTHSRQVFGRHSIKGNTLWKPECCNLDVRDSGSCLGDEKCDISRQIFFKAPYDSPYDTDNISGNDEPTEFPEVNYTQRARLSENYGGDISFKPGNKFSDKGAAWCADKCNQSDSCNAFILGAHEEWPSCLLVNRYSDIDTIRGEGVERDWNPGFQGGTENVNTNMILYNMTAKTTGHDSQRIVPIQEAEDTVSYEERHLEDIEDARRSIPNYQDLRQRERNDGTRSTSNLTPNPGVPVSSHDATPNCAIISGANNNRDIKTACFNLCSETEGCTDFFAFKHGTYTTSTPHVNKCCLKSSPEEDFSPGGRLYASDREAALGSEEYYRQSSDGSVGIMLTTGEIEDRGGILGIFVSEDGTPYPQYR